MVGVLVLLWQGRNKMNIINKLFCKHDWTNKGFSYIECKLCGKTKYNPKLSTELRNETINMMINKGLWNKEEVDKFKIKYGV